MGRLWDCLNRLCPVLVPVNYWFPSQAPNRSLSQLWFQQILDGSRPGVYGLGKFGNVRGAGYIGMKSVSWVKVNGQKIRCSSANRLQGGGERPRFLVPEAASPGGCQEEEASRAAQSLPEGFEMPGAQHQGIVWYFITLWIISEFSKNKWYENSGII